MPAAQELKSSDPQTLAVSHMPAESMPLNVSPPTRQHSKSMPSTPSQRPHQDKDSLRSPSSHRNLNNISPRSLQSDNSHAAVPRKPHIGCKYETGMARARRRVPYSLGPEKLDAEPEKAAKCPSRDQEEMLSKDIRELYGQLVPTLESERRRKSFVAKLETILLERWPEQPIRVNVFGSTGNNLGTSDSDVDCSITTDNPSLNRVCSIAELLASKGMERVVCVSSAKVPIVKLWDPEHQVACDLNVNNPMALENTALIRSYVEIDERVRPLAMIIKHWAKRRILNDAALGGTLSSYTWICLTLNFLQTLNSPILPSLQSQPGLQPKVLDGVNVAFERDLNKFSAFGAKNDSSLGDLLYQFFRYYAHEFDFEENVVSVRLGKLLPKSTKGWNLLQDNRLCVEEPFNTTRNLANTADDTSMRGIHLELRRAFDLIGEGKLEECCEQYEYPPDEFRPSEHLVLPQSRPVNLQAPQPQPPRGSKNSRNGRNGGHLKGNVAARRSSNPINRQQMHLRNLPFQMTTQELQSQALHQQYLLHDQLFQQYQYLQMQEQELRARLNQQNMRQQSILAQQRGNHASSSTLYGNQEDNIDSSTAAAFGGQHRGPLSAPLYQHARFGAPSPFLPQPLPVNGIVTNPSSPHLSSVTPDSRRYSRRTSVGQSSIGGSLRAQSQPARGLVSSMSMSRLQPAPELPDYSSSRRSSASASATTHESGPTYSSQRSYHGGGMYESNRKPAEYVGYFVGQSPYLQSTSISPMSSHTGLAIHNGGLSPRVMSRSPHRSSNGTRTTSPAKDPETRTSSQESTTTVTDNVQTKVEHTPSPAHRQVPLIVDGSVNSPLRRRPNGVSHDGPDEHMAFSGSTSEDMAFDTPSSSDDADETSSQLRPEPGIARNGTAHQAAATTNGYASNYADVVTESEVCDQPPNRAGMSYPNHKLASTAWSLPRQLSAVQEVRTPSPGFEISPPMTSPLGAGAPREAKSSPLATRDSANAGLALRMNGAPQGASNGSSWQTSTNRKKHRKKKTMTKSENDAETLNAAGGDVLPLDDTQRKGG